MKSKLKSNSSFTILIGVVSLLLAVVGITAAYFSVTVIGNNEASSIITNTVNLGNIIFTDGNDINVSNVYPGWSETKTFTVANTTEGANNEISYAIFLYEETNTLTDAAYTDFSYSLSGTSTNGGTTINITDEMVPYQDYDSNYEYIPSTILLSDEGVLNGIDTHTYNFTIELRESGEDQNEAQGKEFSGVLQVNVAADIGKLTWDAENSSWREYVALTSENCFNAEEYEDENEEDKVIINGYYSYENNNSSNPACPKEVNIPSTINGISVTSINAAAFQELGIEKIIIPNTVTYIGSNSFAYNNIENLVIPNSVTYIGENAFQENNIAKLTLSNSLITIGDSAFYWNSLKTITIPSSVTTIGHGAFGINKIKTITIPSSVTTIESFAFSDNQLTSVCIKGKSNSAAFSSYGTNIWGWVLGYSDSNIIWNCTN